MSKPVAHPPTKTTSPKRGPSRLATLFSSSILELGTVQLLQPQLDLFHGHLPFAGPAVTNGIDQREHFVQKRIPQGRLRDCLIERSKRISPRTSLGERPNWRRVVP